MNQKQFLAYFQATEKSSSVNDDNVKVMKYVKSATGHASNAELNLAENEIKKSSARRSKNTRKTFQEMSEKKSVNTS